MHRPAGLAVVSDGSGLPDAAGRDPGDVFAALAADVRLLGTHTSLSPFPVVATARDAGELAAAVRALPASTAAVFVARTDPVRARTVQCDLARGAGIPIVTEEDTVVIALATQVLVALRRAEIAPCNARVVVAGADTAPLLALVLTAAGIGDIVSWTTADALGFPLSGVAREAGIVIDLADVAGAIRPVFGNQAPLTIRRSSEPTAHLLALPGLLRALWDVPRPGWAGDPARHVEVHRACAQALVTLVPVDRLLPELADPDLVHRVAEATVDVLRRPYAR
ncbi:hypothetical protein AB0J40_09280 [Amycolatopsis sp. NPDC049691]|uniref:hypothetical protein n=1 Tax=Amycolatopsis sp. NPDC049691 TaxID=3155155 RepID=UPI00343EBB85